MLSIRTYALTNWEFYAPTEELANWKQTDNLWYDKIKRMLEQICTTPKTGIGKPEALKYEWSLRIERENRLVYRFDDDCIYYDWK